MELNIYSVSKRDNFVQIFVVSATEFTHYMPFAERVMGMLIR